jgi:hypothetical protein
MTTDNTMDYTTFAPEIEEDTAQMTNTDSNELPGADLADMAFSGSRDTEARASNAAYQLGKLKTMPFHEMNEIASGLFQDNHYQRILFYSWIRTLQNCRNPKVNPRYYTPNFIGDPGYGKSGLCYEFGNIMTEWLTAQAGEPLEFKVVVRTLAGINDFADIMGIVAVDREEWNTRLAPPMAFPREGDKTFGLLFIDDFNRGHQHVIAGAMEFVNTGR